MRSRRQMLVAGRIALAWFLLSAFAAADSLPKVVISRPVDFVKDIQPLFAARCVSCHGADKQRNGLRLDAKAAALKGGEGGPVIVPGKSAESRLFQRVTSTEKNERMPSKGEPLTPEQVGLVRLWIDQGAKWPDGVDTAKARDPRDWWSLKPITRPAVPAVSAAEAQWVRNALDAFIVAKLREKGMGLSPEADRRTLLRRLSFDLIGLPPTPDEVNAFVADHDPLAYERLVDRLLASPRYGERWARHWLDVVHYGDTHGYDKDKPRPHAWPYRDYVIRALNQDKPYAQFVLEQLAGDVLFPDTEDGSTAVGFIAAGPWDFIGHAEVPEDKTDGKIARLLDRDDMVSNTLNTFASLTVQCARCHNHKFDPVTQEDYYRLQAVFAALDRTDRVYDTDPAVARRRAELSARKKELMANQKWLDEQVAWLNLTELTALDQFVNAAARAERDFVAKALEEVNRSLSRLPPPHVVYAAGIHYGSGAFSGTGPSGGKPRAIHVLQRGDVRSPGKVVGPGTVPLLPGEDGRFAVPDDAPESQRRAALARWLTDPRHPLTWRSAVNRVWQYHFGRGLVDSPNDFGRMGQLPSHPELLDWLAAEFRDRGQSLKQLHRLIVTSAAYRQSSAVREDYAKMDANNTYLWRMNRRKLEAEAVRDSVLAVSGMLRDQMGGPAFQDFVVEKPEHSPHYEYHLHDPDNPATHRRSVYRFLVRSQPQPFMTTLDCADPSMSVDKRNETLTALQALALLNNRFMLTMARHLAERAARQAESAEEQILFAFRLALGRSPARGELEGLTAYAKRHGLANACRVILNLNEFVFVD